MTRAKQTLYGWPSGLVYPGGPVPQTSLGMEGYCRLFLHLGADNDPKKAIAAKIHFESWSEGE